MIQLVLVVTLLVLSSAGVVSRIDASGARVSEPCTAAATAAVRFQSVVTRDLRSHNRLHADANGFARELASLGAARCPETLRFLRGAEETLDALCGDCVVVLRDARADAA